MRSVSAKMFEETSNKSSWEIWTATLVAPRRSSCRFAVCLKDKTGSILAMPAGRVRLGPRGLSLAHLQAGQDRAQEVSHEARTSHIFYCSQRRWKPCRHPLRPLQSAHPAAIEFCAPPAGSAALRQPCRSLACFQADRASRMPLVARRPTHRRPIMAGSA